LLPLHVFKLLMLAAESFIQIIRSTVFLSDDRRLS
jgi:hypothetical protein